MINSILNLAENIGKKLATADFNFLNIFALPQSNKFCYYQIKPFRENENGVAHWVGFMSNYTNIKKQITFFVSGNAKDIWIYAKIPESLKTYFENTFYSSFPTSDLTLLKNPNFNLKWTYIRFKEIDILSDVDFNKNWVYLDPFKDLISSYYDVTKELWTLNIYFDVVFKWKSFFLLEWIKKAIKMREKADEKSDKPTENPKEQKNIKFRAWFVISSNNELLKNHLQKNILSSFDKFKKWWKIEPSSSQKYIKLSMSQIVNFFHLPTKENYIKNLDYVTFRKLPYPSNVPTLDNTENNDITLLWITDYKTDNVRFWIKKEDKFRHIYTIGKTWMWKSTLLSNMARSDMVTNNGLAVVDPHWDLIETLLEHVPTYRTNDVILFDVSDTNNPIWFNVFEYETEEEKNLIVSGIVSIFKKLYDNSWWPRLEYILRNVILSVIEYPNSTLLHLNRMLTEKNFREEVLWYVKDPIVLKFRRTEFDKRTDKFRDEAIAPIINKVWQFLSSTLMRNIFGQPKSKLKFRQIMDEGKILLINLSKWRIWEDNTDMIGSFFVTKFQIDAMSRANIPYNQRKDFFLYIDEFQNFATDSFESILSEARKYKLSLIVANQYISQIDEKIRNAIFGNVWTIISFALWHDDAIIMSNQFKWQLSPNDLLSLPKFSAYGKIMVDGIGSDPFSMTTFPLPNPELGQEIADKIRKQSRQRYGMEREKLELMIKNWADKKFSASEKIMEQAMEEAKKEAEAKSKVKKTTSTEIKKEEKPVFKSGEIISTAEEIKTEKKLEEIDTEKSLLKQDEQTVETKTPEFKPADIDQSEDTEIKLFSIEDIKIGERYDGLVKLKYNYGLFVTVKWVEWLLHKKLIKLPSEDFRWKDLYNIGDRIKVKVDEIKDIEWVQRIVWSQL